jgi:hypothetical protein
MSVSVLSNNGPYLGPSLADNLKRPLRFYLPECLLFSVRPAEVSLRKKAMSGSPKDGIDVGLSNHAEKMAANIYGTAQDVFFPLVVFPDLGLTLSGR